MSLVTVYLLGRPSLPDQGDPRVLQGLAASEVQELSIQTGSERLTLGRADREEQVKLAAFGVSPGEWVVRRGMLQPADTAAVHHWLSALLSARAGLPARLPAEPPAARVELAGAAFGRTQLSFYEGALGWRVVVQRSSARRAFQLPRHTAEACMPDIDRLQDSRIAPVRRSQVRAISLRRWPLGQSAPASEPSTLRLQQEQGQLRLTAPFDGQRPSPRAMRALWLSLADLRIHRRLAGGQARSAVAADPRVEVVLELEAPARPVRFKIGGLCPAEPGPAAPTPGPAWVVARSSPPLFGCLYASALSPLLRPTGDWVDYSLFEGDVESVHGLRIGGASSVEVRRRADAYWLEGARPQLLAPEAVRARLAALFSLHGQPTPAPKQSGPPQAEVTLMSKGSRSEAADTLSQRVSFYDNALALRHADNTWLRLRGSGSGSSGLPPEVLPDTTLLRSLQVFDYPPEGVVGFEVTAPGAKQQIVRRGGQLVLQPQPGAQLDASLGSELVKSFAQLRARRWVTDRHRPPGYGLSRPRLRAVLRAADGPSVVERTVLVGRLTRDGFFAAVDRYPGVFVLDRDLVELASQPWSSRGLFSVDDPRWAWVRLQAGGPSSSTVELARRPYGWEIIAGEVRPELSQQLVQALTGVVAERLVRSGAPLPSEGLAQPILRVAAGSRSGQADLRWFVGARDALSGVSVHYAWRSDRAKVYALSRSRVARLLALLGG